MTRIAAMTMGALLLPSLSGCMSAMMASHAAPAAAPAAAGSPAGAPATMQACPMAVPGTQVMASETAGGEALTFTTTAGDVEELRRRAHAMAGMHGHHHAMGAGMQHMAGGMGHGAAMMGPDTTGGGSMGGAEATGGHGSHAMPPSSATVQDVEGGARIVVQPRDPADLEKVRLAISEQAERLRQRGCAAMGGM